ncbi:MAG TPA: DUF1003 domain-containing protein [Candidatus Nanoarchaeia archaeon]|nr:DUF1003 domain-containing protein [Candidatus Woesearchaeota archaeon]HIG93459.1 DUF1003 domain-containing protein [Candidatus Woesearchaeota archaeon]HIH12327.1 DUF1003 domain-containing protein [Candidatus Woesearchaeota archaeon]HLC71801.1 DUF1003 domain-containing protein [Candidatus Nanoarchaeia archaeon]
MIKRGHKIKEDNKLHSHKHHPIFRLKLSLGQRTADRVSTFTGSWRFIVFFFMFMFLWIAFNSFLLIFEIPIDPFPFILLNLGLSTLAAIQAPIILMAQNRQAERDRVQANYDYKVNRKAEREIEKMQQDLESIKGLIQKRKR